MIKVTLKRNQDGHIWAFTADDHGSSQVCTAVSLMILNTANSIEAFTDVQFTCQYDEKGGHIQFEIPGLSAGGVHHDVNLLLEAMYLGLRSVEERYGEIKINERT